MKRLELILIFLMTIALALGVYSLGSNKMRIREIPDVEDWGSYPYDMEVVIKCYLIDNPPTDFGELRDLAEKHIDENLNEIASVPTMYKCFFYRVSKRLPWNWKEQDGHMLEDHIEHHTGDMIIAVRWTSEDSLREYTIMKKSESEDNYGLKLEEVHYEGTSIKN